MALGNQGSVLVVGAGISGLAAALSLLRAGYSVRVFERAEQAPASATGLVLSRRGLQALELLGVGRGRLHQSQELARVAIQAYRGGRPWAERRIARDARALLLARDELHRALLEEVLRSASDEVIVPRHTLASFVEDADGVTVTFANGQQQRGRALIGADGVHSRVRRALHGDVRLDFHGRTTFRGLCDESELMPQGADYVEYHAPDARLVHYGLGGGRSAWQANVTGRVPVTTNATQFLAERFAEFPERARRCLAATPTAHIQRTAICDLPTLEHWGQGRVTLLGDAAHPMTPDLGQGASQALEDAVVLGSELLQSSGLALAFERYQARRIRPVATLVRASHLAGSLSNVPGVFGYRLRELGYRLLPEALGARRLAAWSGKLELPPSAAFGTGLDLGVPSQFARSRS